MSRRASRAAKWGSVALQGNRPLASEPRSAQISPFVRNPRNNQPSPPMKIIRFIDAAAQVRYGAQLPDGTRVELDGDPYEGNVRITSRPADVRRLLAPVAPTNIFAVGLN